jgi:hypothetical protein
MKYLRYFSLTESPVSYLNRCYLMHRNEGSELGNLWWLQGRDIDSTMIHSQQSSFALTKSLLTLELGVSHWYCNKCGFPFDSHSFFKM